MVVTVVDLRAVEIYGRCTIITLTSNIGHGVGAE
jgi:hypothetical protein